MKWTRKDFHRSVFLLGIFLLITGIPTSRFLMSVGQISLSVNWILEANYGQKLRRLWSRPGALILLSFYALHFIGLLYSQDLQYGLKDLRIKLPFLALPIIFASAEGLSRKEWRMLLLAYTIAVAFGSLRSMWELVEGNVADIRNISVYISHIRFSLNICLAIFILGRSLSDKWFTGRWKQILQLVLLIWLFIFLVLLQSFTGIVVFIITSITLLFVYGLRQQRKPWKLAMLGTAVLIPLISLGYIWSLTVDLTTKEDIDFGKLDLYSAEGEFYHHDTLNQQTVNGYYVWIYLAENELKRSWEERSELPYDGFDEKGHSIRDILIRYLSSSGLRKDAQGMQSLTDEEIRRIEEGVANASCTGPNVIKSRICQILWEYDNYLWTGDPSGHSVLMRYEYWKAALGIIRSQPIAGVGTGDLDMAFRDQYNAISSTLDPEWRLRSHNQYLSILAAFGIIGLLVFLAAFIVPPILSRGTDTFLFRAFFIIAILSMLTEDTLESQAGATFVAFFYCYLLLLPTRSAP